MRAVTKVCLAGVVALSLFSACLGNRSTERVFRLGDFLPSRVQVLPSGLELILEHEKSAPVVGVGWVARAGAANDPEGKEGLAHLVEHLAFRAIHDGGFPAEQRLRQLAAPEGFAFTGTNGTRYLAFTARELLEPLLLQEVDRMRDPLAGITEAIFQRELGVVRAELDYRDPHGEASRIRPALAALLFAPGHPNRKPVGGTRESLARLTLADAQAFVAKEYQPRNLAVVLSGDLSSMGEDRILALFGKAFALAGGTPIQPVHLPNYGDKYDAPPAGNALTTISGPGPFQHVFLGWVLPPLLKEQAISEIVARRIQANLRGVGETGNLPKPLKLTVVVEPGIYGSAMIVHALLPANANARAVDAEIRSRMGWFFAAQQHDTNWYERTMFNAASRRTLEITDLRKRMLMNLGLVLTGTAYRAQYYLRDMAAMSTDEVAYFSLAYLRPDQAKTLVVRPANLPMAGPGPGIASPSRPKVDPPNNGPAPGRFPPPPGRRLQTRVLGNGLRVLVDEDPSLPTTTALWGSRVPLAPREDPAFGHLFDWQAGRRLEPTSENKHLAFSCDVEKDSVRLAVSDTFATGASVVRGLAGWHKRLREGVDLEGLADFAARYRVEVAMTMILDRQAFRKALWGDHPLGAGVAALPTGTDLGARLQAWSTELLHPRNSLLVVVGKVDAAEIFQLAEREFGPTSDPWIDQVATEPGPEVKAPKGLGEVPLGTQSEAVGRLRFGCRLPLARSPEDFAAGKLLASQVEAWVRSQFMDEAGASYSPSAFASYYRGGWGELLGEVDIPPTEMAASIAWLCQLWQGSDVLDAGTFESLRWRAQRELLFPWAASASRAGLLFERWNLGTELHRVGDPFADYQAVTLDDLNAALRGCRANALIGVLGTKAGEEK